MDTKSRIEQVEAELRANVAIANTTYAQIVDILQTVYAGGYVNNRMNYDEKKALRAKSYRVLKALGVEK